MFVTPEFNGPHRQASRSGQALWAHKFLAACAMVVSLTLACVPARSAVAADAASTVYESPEAAYESGRNAIKKGDFRGAIKPLSYAAKGGSFLAKYYLAEILADTRHIFADPHRAFTLYSELIDANQDVDPFYDFRARFVARAYVMKGRYLSGARPVDGIELSQVRARRLFGHAATYLDYPDAQFEFARMLMKGRGGARNVRSGKHYLSTLSRKGHAAAQGYLAELFWQGELVPKRADYALALSTLAVRNAQRDDRIWLEELHHEISCGTSAQVHEDAERLLLEWQKTHRTQEQKKRRRTDVFRNAGAQWSCGGTNKIAADPGSVLDENAVEDEAAMVSETDTAEAKEAWPDQGRLEALHGSMFDYGTGGTGLMLDNGAQ